ncbi:MAG: PpiC-type peptidyl-prolyl cis-trans isomerase [Verrucomicrobiales bacterium]|nr:PpiC-type peptidyl-prolyl cis-trans isomerase [Verrucomicrobiales bacterium]
MLRFPPMPMKMHSTLRAVLLLPGLAVLAPPASSLGAGKTRPAPLAESSGSITAVRVPSAAAVPETPDVQPEGSGRSNGIVAVANGRPILKSELEEKMAMLEMQARGTIGNRAELDRELADLRRKTLDGLIEQELILKEFEPFAASFGDKVNALTDEHIRTQIIGAKFNGERTQLVKALTSQGLTYKKFYEMQRNATIVSIMRGQNTRDVGYVTSQEKAAYLAAHGEEFREGDQIKLWSITIPQIGEAIGATPAVQQALVKDIRAKLLRGSDFGTLAKTYSQDLKAGNGGDWGFITRKDFTQRLVDTVFKLPVKKVSDIIEYEGSYFIFYVEARNPGKMRPKEEVEPALEQAVLAEKRRKAYDKWISGLKDKATIRYYDR